MSEISFNALGAGQAAKLAKAAAAQKAEPAAKAVAEGVGDFRDALQQAEKASMETAVSGADPHAMVEALANAELVVEAAVTVRDKVVEAYQELLRMPV
ncbi:MAG: flagellar hook-basal body complex protein FliE [Pseudomonadota bacterium]